MMVVWLPPASAQQLLDRVVARVNGIAITQTDVEAALGLGVVSVEPGEDAIAPGTRQLVDRQLLLAEVARFPPPEPGDAAVADVVAAMTAHAGERYDALLRATGLDEQRVRDLARDTLRIDAYVSQRFGTTPQVSTQDARDYYDTHRQAFVRDGVLPPFEAIEAEVRQAASAERRRATVARWIADLRARGDVVEVTPRPSRP